MENINSAGEINIDSNYAFFNPFGEIKNKCDGGDLYEKYFKHPRNRKYLKLIGNKNIITDDEDTLYSRKIILEKLAKYYYFRSIDTSINASIFQIKKGIILNHLIANTPLDKSGIYYEYSNKYPFLKSSYEQHKVKSSGVIHVGQINEDLYIFNLFNNPIMNPTDSFRFIKRVFLKTNLYINKLNKKSLPIYAPNNMGEKMCIDLVCYSNIVSKYFPNIIYCNK